jgi:hypothetical protein
VIEVTSEGQSIWECTGWGAAATCQGNRDYQAYRLGTPDLEMYLFFDPRVVGGHDPVTIEKAFLHLWMNVYFPHRREEDVHVQTDAIRRGDPQLKRLTVEGHTVNVEIELKPVMQVLYWIESRHQNCVSGDILGRCAASRRGQSR